MSLQLWQSLKVSQLQGILTRLGSQTSGKKLDLIFRLQKDLQQERLSFRRNKDGREVASVLSVDMGIKNLAYCFADVEMVSNRAATKSSFDAVKPKLHVRVWSRTSVLENSMEKNINGEAEQFTASKFSSTALKIIESNFLTLEPSTILIERQRFRSAGSAAVQEWTIRVNTLEAMFWGILITMRSYAQVVSHMGRAKDLMLSSIEPARVANFWFPEPKKVTKKNKIDLVKGWLTDAPPDNLDLQLMDHLVSIQQSMTRSRASRMKDGVLNEYHGKLDDLADCFLQAAAVASWEANRRSLVAMGEEQLIEHARSQL